MTTSEWLLLAQTVVLLLTATVIFWYTWETQRLRKSANRQAELQQGQLETMRQRLDMDVREQLRASRPFFRWRGGSTSMGTWKREFQNEGAPISHLSIQAERSRHASIASADLLQTNQISSVTANVGYGPQTLPDPWEFEIRYRTRLDVEETKNFVVQNGTPREIERKA